MNGFTLAKHAEGKHSADYHGQEFRAELYGQSYRYYVNFYIIPEKLTGTVIDDQAGCVLYVTGPITAELIQVMKPESEKELLTVLIESLPRLLSKSPTPYSSGMKKLKR